MNEEEKEAIKELIDSSNLSLIGDGTMIVKNTTIATTLNYIDKLQKELDKKNKVIDLMAEYLNENNREFWTDDIEETKQYFYKKVEEENDI